MKLATSDTSSVKTADPKKTQAVIDMPHPETRKDLQRFLGMLTYLGKFIPNLSYQAPTRLQTMIMSIQKYPINVVYRLGKQLVIADTLSRSYIKDSTDSSTSFKFEVNKTLTTVPISDDKLRLLQTQTYSDLRSFAIPDAAVH